MHGIKIIMAVFKGSIQKKKNPRSMCLCETCLYICSVLVLANSNVPWLSSVQVGCYSFIRIGIGENTALWPVDGADDYMKCRYHRHHLVAIMQNFLELFFCFVFFVKEQNASWRKKNSLVTCSFARICTGLAFSHNECI